MLHHNQLDIDVPNNSKSEVCYVIEDGKCCSVPHIRNFDREYGSAEVPKNVSSHFIGVINDEYNAYGGWSCWWSRAKADEHVSEVLSKDRTFTNWKGTVALKPVSRNGHKVSILHLVIGSPAQIKECKRLSAVMDQHIKDAVAHVDQIVDGFKNPQEILDLEKAEGEKKPLLQKEKTILYTVADDLKAPGIRVQSVDSDKHSDLTSLTSITLSPADRNSRRSARTNSQTPSITSDIRSISSRSETKRSAREERRSRRNEY